MLKLHQIFFRRFLILFIFNLAFIGIFTYITIKDIELKRVEENLKSIILVSAPQLQNQNNFELFVKNLKEITHLRLTIIDEQGVVRAETDKDKKLLDNHLMRDEIQAALHGDFGISIRQSDSVNKDMIYVAKKIWVDHKPYFLRVARYVDDFNQEFLVLSFQILFLLALFLVIAFAIAYNLNNQIKYEIDKISDYLKDIVGKNFNMQLSSTFSSEFFKISQMLSKLAQKLKNREEKKAKYTEKLLHSNQQKDEIISAISHEFKNPIAVINGYCETLIADKNIRPEIRDKFLDKISHSAVRLTNMIDRLRFATKLEDKQFKATFKECNIEKICQRIIANLKVEYPSRGVQLVVNSHELVRADEVLIEMALLNLVENGLKYSELDVVIVYEDGSISVVDRGIGIKQDELAKITDKFYRINTNVWNNSLGLGLSIVKNILSLQDFALQIDSHLNEGSTFKIILKN